MNFSSINFDHELKNGTIISVEGGKITFFHSTKPVKSVIPFQHIVVRAIDLWLSKKHVEIYNETSKIQAPINKRKTKYQTNIDILIDQFVIELEEIMASFEDDSLKNDNLSFSLKLLQYKQELLAYRKKCFDALQESFNWKRDIYLMYKDVILNLYSRNSPPERIAVTVRKDLNFVLEVINKEKESTAHS